MKIKHHFRAAALLVVVSTTQSEAVTFRHSGSLTVESASGTFEPFSGKSGSFFYEIDFGVPDPDPSAVAGIFNNAVLRRGITIGDQTFVDTSKGALNINFDRVNGYNFWMASQFVSSTDFSNVAFGIIVNFDPVRFDSHLLLDGKFGATYGYFLPGRVLSVEVLGLTEVEGSNPFNEMFEAVGTIDSSTVVEQPDPGNGGGQPPPVSPVPVPGALPLMISAICGIFLIRRRRSAA